jgi:ABC transport system ATP-binding/permease protein
VPILTAERLRMAYGHVALLEGADLRLEPGERVCLLGRNGAGKSTLLQVVSGEVAPDAGTVWRAPGLRVARLAQDVLLGGPRSVFDVVAEGLGSLGALVSDYHHAAVSVAADPAPERLARLGELQQRLERADGWRLEQRVELVLSRLALPADTPIDTLSGGLRRRVLLAQALASSPDLLLLDEPTNHLDIDAIAWLEEFLLGYAGTLLFVTHDRALVSRLATRIVELDRGRLTSWAGDYDAYRRRRQERLEAEQVDWERLDTKLAREEAWLRRGIKARRTRDEGRVRALVALREARAGRREHTGVVRMELDGADPSGKLVFALEDVSLRYGAQVVIDRCSTRILRGHRVGVIGPNGSGKSTFLRLLLGELAPSSGEVRRGANLHIAYYDQQREQLDPAATVFETVGEGRQTVVVGGRERHVAGYLSDFLFPRERMQSPVHALSGGERNRLLLARLLARPANVLVLDEPTNDLDVETLELLEDLLEEFDGTILLVSHDRVFLDNVVTSTLAFEPGGRVREYVGGWDDYRRQRTAEEQAAVPEKPTARARPQRERAPADAARLSYRDRQELEALPERIAELERERAVLEAEMGDAGFYLQGAQAMTSAVARAETVTQEIDRLYERWYELESRGSGAR